MMKKLLAFLLLVIPCLVYGSENTLQNETGCLSWSEKGLAFTPAFEAPKVLGDSQSVNWSILLIEAWSKFVNRIIIFKAESREKVKNFVKNRFIRSGEYPPTCKKIKKEYT